MAARDQPARFTSLASVGIARGGGDPPGGSGCWRGSALRPRVHMHARAARRTRDDDRARRRRRRDREGRDRRLPGRGAGGTREREALGAGGSRSRIPYVHRSCRRLSPTSQKLKPTTAGIETLLRREVCEPRFWAAIYSWSEGAKSAHFDSGKLSSAKFGTCVVG